MIRPTPVPYVDELLGGTTLYEEQRGDFAKARLEAERQLDAARLQANPLQLADALLARGIVHMLQGEMIAARACFDESQQHVAGDVAREWRAHAYAYETIQLGYNTLPDGSASNSQDISARIELMSIVRAMGRHDGQIEQTLSDPSLLMEMTLLRQQGTIQSCRKHMSFGSIQTYELRKMLANDALSVLERQAIEGADPQICALLGLQAADLFFRATDRTQAFELLDRASNLYDEHSDQVGFANCLTTMGDWMVAPLSTPLLWNCAVQTSLFNNRLSEDIEAIEGADTAANADKARTLYEQAEQRYRSGGATRGLAAIKLRYAYLVTIERNPDAPLEAGFEHALEQLAEARELYAAAGDQLGVQVAEAHRVLCQIGMGKLPEDTATARSIGRWGRESGSLSFALGLGLLFARVGRRWLVREGDCERALACFRLAESLFGSLGTALAEVTSIADQVLVYELIGERNAMAIGTERAIDACGAIISSQPDLADAAWSFTADLSTRAFNNATNIPDRLERVSLRLRKLVASTPFIAQRQDLVEDLLAGGDIRAISQAISQASQQEDAEENQRPKLSLTHAMVALGYIEMAAFMLPLGYGNRARDAGDDAAAAIWYEQAFEAARKQPGSLSFLMQGSIRGRQRRYTEAAELARHHLYLEHQQIEEHRAKGWSPELLKVREHTFVNLAFMTFTNLKLYADARPFLAALEQSEGERWWSRESRPWESLMYIGEWAEGLEDWPRALAAYEQAMEQFELRRRLLTSDELKTALASGSMVQNLYFEAARAALKAREAALAANDAPAAQAMFERAFSYIERGKARSLLDLVAGGSGASSLSTAEDRALRDWRRLSAYLATRRSLLAAEYARGDQDQLRIDALREDIAAKEEELDTLEATLSNDDDLFAAQRAYAQVLALPAVCAALAPDTALLQYAFLGEDLIAWALTNDGVAAVHRAGLNAPALRRQMRALHRHCEQHLPLEGLDQALADVLLAPFGQVLRNYTELLIVPYADSHLVPFHMLLWNGQPLAASHAVAYLPSASMIQLRATAAHRVHTRSVLAVGNPAYMSLHRLDGLQPRVLGELPAAETEAAYIANLFPASTLLIGEMATAQAVGTALTGHPIIHFATHGHLDQAVPLQSAIMLANGDTLTVYDLMGLRLDADLVVMSACRTGQGETTGGDDVLGLTRGLLGAGARSAVVSLWPVDDVSTSLLMGEFYRQLAANLSPAAALRAAQNYLRCLSVTAIDDELRRLQSTLERAGSAQSALHPVARERSIRDLGPETQQAYPNDYAHPYYWAAFVIVG